MPETKCANCKLRARYDKNPRSILGRVWRWHVSWCPGWKAYMASLPVEDRKRLASAYDLKAFQDP